MSLNYSELNQDNNNSFKNAQNQYMNGRVTMPKLPVVPFELFQGEQQETSKSYSQTTLENALETTPVSKFFFSHDNKEFLHNQIINQIFLKTNKQQTIGRQSDLHLLIIMRSIYFQYSRNNFCDIQEQVNTLNNMVIKDCVSRILIELEQRKSYTNFVTSLPQQMPLPKNPSIKGDKILYSKIG